MEQVVISVGMGPGQVDFIRYLKECGFIVVAFGKGENSPEAIELADYSSEIDTLDAEQAIEWINSLGVEVIGVGSYAGGRAVQTVQELSRYYETATRLPNELIVGSDKAQQQCLYEKYRLSTIKTWNANQITIEEIEHNSIEEYILKPKVGRGSKGICYVSKNEMKMWLKENGACSEDFIVQTVHRGDEYRCVVIVQNGEIKMLAPVLRKSYRDTVFLGVLKYCESDLQRLLDFFAGFIRDAGIENSIIKADVIVSENAIDLIEMDIGVGGGSYYKTFVSKLYERNLMEDYVRLITGRTIEPYIIKNPYLQMDYVFNQHIHPVQYDLNACKAVLREKIGDCEILVNRLHPEKKGGFESNADFIFCVIHCRKEEPQVEFEVDSYVNEHLFSENVCC